MAKKRTGWTVTIHETDAYSRDAKPVILTPPIFNPDSAPAIIEVDGKHYRYAGSGMGGGKAVCQYVRSEESFRKGTLE